MKPPTIDIEDLAQRLDRLERENRRLKRVGSLLVVGFAAMVLMGQTVPKSRTLEAERFILKDASGVTRAELGTWAGDFAGLAIRDQGGNTQAVLHADKDGHVLLILHGKDFRGGTYLETTADGSGSLTFMEGKTYTAKDYRDVGIDIKEVLSGRTTKRARVHLTSGYGSPHLTLYDENSRARAILGHTALEATRTGVVEKTAASSLVLFDKEGKVLWQAP